MLPKKKKKEKKIEKERGKKGATLNACRGGGVDASGASGNQGLLSVEFR